MRNNTLQNPQRLIIGHEFTRVNRQVRITADQPGPGGASHNYEVNLVSAPESSDFPIPGEFMGQPVQTRFEIPFQYGPLREFGLNGITDEALLAILIDRLEGFQKGQYACRQNALVLTKLQEAKHWLQDRYDERERRGVEGTSTV